MVKQSIPFTSFLEAAGTEHIEFINQSNQLMLDNNCKVEIKEAKSGYLVSYVHTPTARTVANYVFRKKGLMIRIYADHVPEYMSLLDNWPESMKNTIRKATPCKRLLDPNACNPRCVMGFDFILDGNREQKCRNSSFMFFLDPETKPHLKDMLEREMQARKAG